MTAEVHTALSAEELACLAHGVPTGRAQSYYDLRLIMRRHSTTTPSPPSHVLSATALLCIHAWIRRLDILLHEATVLLTLVLVLGWHSRVTLHVKVVVVVRKR